MWNHFANEFNKQLLIQDFEDNTDYCFKYDISDVRALSQDVGCNYEQSNSGIRC